MQTLVDSKFNFTTKQKQKVNDLYGGKRGGKVGHYVVSIFNLNFPAHFPNNVLHISTTFHHVFNIVSV